MIKPFDRTVKTENSCWEWQGTCNRGYGHLRFNGRRIYAHRLAWEQTFGPIPPGLMVCHACDNRKCCNPDHLMLGTPAANSIDMVAKGRSARPAGESNAQARLTRPQVVAIKEDGRSSAVIAAELGVARSTVAMIKTGRNWAHV